VLLTIEAFVERAVDMYLGDQEGLFGEHAEKQDTTKKTEDAPADNDVNPDEATKKEDTPSNRPTMRPSMTRQSSVYIRMTQEHDGKVASQYLVANKRPSVIGLVQVNEVGQVDEKQTVNPWVALLLLLVLSIHVLIEGLTIGSVDGEDVMRSTFIAIVFHKVFSAFALGSSFITSGYWEKKRPGGRNMFYIMTIFYASMDVVGIGSGMAIGNAFNGESYATAILTSMLGGSFLFVAAVELVPGELEKTRVFKFPIIPVMFSLLVGFGIMSFIGKYA
jgi:zinc transporter ZupT